MTWLETSGLFLGAFLLALAVGSLVIVLQLRARTYRMVDDGEKKP